MKPKNKPGLIASLVVAWCAVVNSALPQDAGLLPRGINDSTFLFQQGTTTNEGLGISGGPLPTGQLPFSNGTTLIGEQQFFYDPATERFGIGTAGSPQRHLHVHDPGTGATDHSYAIFTTGDTGAALNDGLLIGYAAGNNAVIHNQEATVLQIGSGPSSLFSIELDFDGKVVINEAGAAAADFRVEGDTEPNLFFTDASTNRVGIGTASPDFPFTVDGNVNIRAGSGLVIGHNAKISFGAIPELQVLGTGTSSASMGFARFENNSAGPDVRFLKSRGATIGANVIVQDGDFLGRFRFQGADGLDFNTPGAQVHAEVQGTPGQNDMPTRLVFSTTPDGGSSVVERMTIDRDGNTGIGTAIPGSTLTVEASTDPAVSFKAAANNDDVLVLLQDDGLNLFNVRQSGDAALIRAYDGGGITINLDGDGDSWFNTGGNFGIGTTSPDRTFQVEGGGSGTPTMEISGTTAGDMALELSNTQGSFYVGLNGGEEFAIGINVDSDNNTMFVIERNGEIGIGTANPSAELDVIGDVEISGLLDVGGNSDVEGATIYGHNTAAVNSDDVAVSTTGISVLEITGGGSPASDFTMTLTGGVEGQVLIVYATTSIGDAIELLDAGNVNIAGIMNFTDNAVLTLAFLGGGWLQQARSLNGP